MKSVKAVSLILILAVIWGASLPSLALAQENPPGGEILPASADSPDATNKLYVPIVSKKPATAVTLLNLFGYETWTLSESNGVAKMGAAGATWVRRNALLWEEVEPSRGTRNWSAVSGLENEFRYASSQGQKIILVIRATPAWARMSAYQSKNCSPVRQDALPDFAAFLRDVVARYSVAPFNVKYFEVWNEPDVDPSIITSNEQNFGCWGDKNDPYYGGRYYGEMLKVVYPQMKSANQDAQVLIGGMVMDCNPNNPPSGKDCTPSKYLEGILVSGAKSSFDGVAFHGYDFYSSYGRFTNANWQSSWDTNGSVIRKKAEYLRSVLNANGASDKYLINTEVALICGTDGTESYCQTNDFRNTKAFYVTQAYAAAYLEGLQAAVWYHIFGWRASQLMNHALEGEPAYNAYSFAATRFGQANGAWEVNVGDAKVKAIDFSLPNKTVRLMWALDLNSHTIQVPGSASGIWVWSSGTGAYQSASITSTVNVTVAPVYIEY